MPGCVSCVYSLGWSIEREHDILYAMTKHDNSKNENSSGKKKPKFGSLGKVQQKLYSKMAKIKPYKRKGFRVGNDDIDIPTSWGDEPKQNTSSRVDTDDTSKNVLTTLDLREKDSPDEHANSQDDDEKPKRHKRSQPMTVFTKVLIASVLFFIFSLGAAALVYYLQINEVAHNAVELSVRGPNSIAAGEELEFDVNVANNNQVNVVLSDIVVNYPAGTIDTQEGLEMQKDIKSIDEIPSGLSQSKRFKAILFGSENDVKEITISFQYRVPGSDVLLFKERVYQVELESAPVVINSQHNTNFQSGDEVSITLELVSNASKPLRNLLLAVDFPFGFEFASSSVVGIDPQSYRIGTLEPGERSSITINGIIRGQDNEERTFRYSLGSENSEQVGTLGTVLAVDQSKIVLTKPPITLGLNVNGDTQGDVVVAPGQGLNVDVLYQNNLESKILDTEINAVLRGDGYDIASVQSRRGYYQSSQNRVSWAQSDYGPLAELEPGEGDELEFELDILDTTDLAREYTNPEFTITLEGRGTNFDSGDLNQGVRSEISKRVKIASTLGINAYLLHSSGPFENSGPMYPEVDTETTYTLVLEASNSTNRLEEVEVRAQLPPYVSLREVMEPTDAQVDFDTRAREIIWNIGTLRPGVGYTGNSRRIYLSLSYEPSANQINRVPNIVEDIRITGMDSFTDTQVQAEEQSLDIELEEDEEYDIFANPSVRE